MKKSCLRASSQAAASSSRGQMLPVGLLGELMMMALVRSVTAASSCSGVGKNSVSGTVVMITGLPPAILIISV